MCMAGGQPGTEIVVGTPGVGWRDYVDTRILDRDKAAADLREQDKESLAQQFDALAKAVEETATRTKADKAAANEWRETLTKLVEGFLRNEAFAAFKDQQRHESEAYKEAIRKEFEGIKDEDYVTRKQFHSMIITTAVVAGTFSTIVGVISGIIFNLAK